MGVLLSKYIATYIFIALNDVAIIFNLQQEVFFLKKLIYSFTFLLIFLSNFVVIFSRFVILFLYL